MRQAIFILLAVVLAVVFQSLMVRAFDHKNIAQQSVAQHIRPGYNSLAAAAAALAKTIDAYCKSPAPALRKRVDAHFKAAVLAWAAIEHIRFGPVALGNRYERLVFWPDPRGVGRRQIRRVLKNRSGAVLRASDLAKKSVGLQGLPALEQVLFGTGHKALETPGPSGKFRCGFAQAIAQGFAETAGEIVQGWAADDGFSKTFLSPGPGNNAYQRPVEVTNELFQAYITGLATVRDMKIDRPLGGNTGQPRPKRAQFWRSGLSREVIIANIKAARHLYLNSGFSDAVKADAPDVHARVLREYDEALRILSNLGMGFLQAVSADLGRQKLILLTIPISQARAKSAVVIARLANISMGFNAKDGD